MGDDVTLIWGQECSASRFVGGVDVPGVFLVCRADHGNNLSILVRLDRVADEESQVAGDVLFIAHHPRWYGGSRELSRSLLKFTERGGRASYPPFTAAQG